MSTHFRPRPAPPPTPTSPTRPSTAHSTIRAITPSPPNSSDGTFALPRPKSEHAIGSPELSNFRQYVLKAEAGGFSNTPEVNEVRLQRGGIASGRSSPVKSGRSSPAKSGRSSPVKSGRNSPTKSGRSSPTKPRSLSPRKAALSILEGEGEGEGLCTSPAPHDSPVLHQDSDPDTPPDTPTPMTRAQKRQAYAPLGSSTTFSITQATQPITSAQPQPLASDANANRISSVLSTASKHSIFSTPGRDELERKKALVESDEGPFARAKSMGDLRVERMRVGSAGDGEEREGGDGKDRKLKGKWRCGICAVM
ncbi:hypothetical protein HBI56_237810 [Parastagonospora nodorum]|nr:hypothetical protein HBH53_115170 [Parastagonospora nodorum]KAH3990960.1 hypothetical protein HBI10_240390 [Parastagonospora nodorum]KAH4010360.1 hypothetical protein HBI09_231640 [Parastagonospora nodorum]KAH4019359.1 hypothetical protein HBI13_122950 [Parastagonospora nodorum]KAH4219348.1 hypothetical protein HBI06_189870 [Parastagonospora nodorum]